MLLMTLSLVVWVWHPIGIKLFLSFLILFIGTLITYWIFFYDIDKKKREGS
jgi:hypothetical protein